VAEKDFQIRIAKTIKNLDNKIWEYDIQPWVFWRRRVDFRGVIFTILVGDATVKLFLGIKGWIPQYLVYNPSSKFSSIIVY